MTAKALCLEPFSSDVRNYLHASNKATDKGVYIFAFKYGPHVKIHYLFYYVWDDRGWKISVHRSAALPENESQ
ncbi:hypothetical protein [Pantoea eucrina]|uniref:hypothetical protein n=1 Tax=Pantoea eucrina TaxID=472693 RepID=UPI003CF86944